MNAIDELKLVRAMGERFAPGSEVDVLDQAAQCLRALRDEVDRSVAAQHLVHSSIDSSLDRLPTAVIIAALRGILVAIAEGEGDRSIAAACVERGLQLVAELLRRGGATLPRPRRRKKRKQVPPVLAALDATPAPEPEPSPLMRQVEALLDEGGVAPQEIAERLGLTIKQASIVLLDVNRHRRKR